MIFRPLTIFLLVATLATICRASWVEFQNEEPGDEDYEHEEFEFVPHPEDEKSGDYNSHRRPEEKNYPRQKSTGPSKRKQGLAGQRYPYKRKSQQKYGEDNQEDQSRRQQGFSPEEPAFQQGGPQQTLQYVYDVQTSTFATLDDQRSGLRMQAKLLVQQGGSNCLVKFKDPKFGKMNGASTVQQQQDNSNEIGEMNRFQQVKLDNEQVKVLELPMKYQCRNGQAKKPVFDQEDEPWSMNIKRGVLNLFQVQQKHAESSKSYFQTYEETVEGECQAEYSIVPIHAASLQQHQQQQQQNQFGDRYQNSMRNVTKSINFHNCKNRPQVLYQWPTASKHCFSTGDNWRHPADEDFIQSSSASLYTISGKTIVEAKTNSRYIYEPYGEKADKMVATVNQKVSLIQRGDQNNERQTIQEPRNPQEHGRSVAYSFDWDAAYEQAVMSGRDNLLKKLNKNKSPTNIPAQVMSLFEKICKQSDKSSPLSSQSPRSADKKSQSLINAIRLLRLADAKDMQQIDAFLEKVTSSSGQESLKDEVNSAFAQALGMCGTKICVQKLTELIKRRKISDLAAIFALKQLHNVQIPSESVVLEIMEMARQLENISPSSGSNYFMKQTMWLLAGSMVHSLCSNSLNKFAINQQREQQNQHHHHHSNAACSSQLKHHFIQAVTRNLQQSKNWEEKLIFTKTLSNAGLTETLGILKELIHDRQIGSSWTRNSAIYALRKMAKQRSNYIQTILMPIATNPREPSEIRVSAIKIILDSHPDVSILNQLASMVGKTNKNSPDPVSTFIYSALTTISNSSKLCDKPLIHNARLAVQSMGHHPKFDVRCNETSAVSSLNWFSLTNEKHARSADFEFFASFGNHSSKSSTQMPKHISFHLNKLWAGLYQKHVVGLGLVTTDPEKSTLHNAVYRFMSTDNQENIHQPKQQQRKGKKGNYLHEIWSRGIWPSANSDEESDEEQPYENEYENPGENHEIPESSPFHESFKALVYAELKDQNVGFLPISQKSAQRALTSLRPLMQKMENELRKGGQIELPLMTLFRDAFVKIPTSAGLPLSISIKAPIVWNLGGKVRLGKDENQADQKMKQSNFKIKADLKSSFEGDLQIDYQIWSPIVEHGFKVENRLKLDSPSTGNFEIDLNANRPGSNVKLVLQNVRNNQEFLNAQNRPSTYANQWSEIVKSLDAVDERPIAPQYDKKNKHKQCLDEFVSGAKMCVSKTGSNNPFMVDSLKHAYLGLSLEKPLLTSQAPIEINFSAHKSHNSNNQQHVRYDFTQPDNIRVEKIKVDAKSGQRQATLNLVSLIDPRKMYAKFIAVLTAQSTIQPQKRTMCFVSEGYFLDQARRHVVGSADLKWGAGSCETSNNYITARLSSDILPAPGSKSEFCTDEKCHNPKASDSTYKLNVAYQNVPVEVRNATNKLYRLFKHAVYFDSDVAQIDVHNPPRRINAILTIPANKSQSSGNLVVKTPNENFTLADVHFPSWFFPCKSDNEKPYEKYTKPSYPSKRYPGKKFPDEEYPEEEEEGEYKKPPYPSRGYAGKKENVDENPDEEFSNNPPYAGKHPERKETKRKTKPYNENESEPEEEYEDMDYPDEHENEGVFTDDDDFNGQQPYSRNVDHEDDEENLSKNPWNSKRPTGNDNVLKYQKPGGLTEGPGWMENKMGKKGENPYGPGEEEDEPIGKPEKTKSTWGDDWMKKDKNPEGFAREKLTKFAPDDFHSENENQCRLDPGNQITTVGKKRYKFPLSQCFAVLSKDCRPAERRYIILARKASAPGFYSKPQDGRQQNNGDKELLVLSRTHKISVRLADKNMIHTRVNDAPFNLKEGVETYAPGSKNTKLHKKGKEIVINLQELGIKVQFDGQNVLIEFSPEAAKKQCGLCGRMDDKNWPDSTHQDQLVSQYVINDGQCAKSAFGAEKGTRRPHQQQQKQPQFRKQQPYSKKMNPKEAQHWDDQGQQPQSDSMKPRKDDISGLHDGNSFDRNKRHPLDEDSLWKRSPSSMDEPEFENFDEDNEENDNVFEEEPEGRQSNIKPIKAYKIIETEDKTCTSLDAVPKCPKNSYAEQEVEKRIPFYCLNKSEPKAQQLKQKIGSSEEKGVSGHQSQIPELQNVQPNQFITVEIPLKCVQY